MSAVQFHTLFEEATEGILIATPEGRYIDANLSVCKMLGYSHDEFLSLSIPDIIDMHVPEYTPQDFQIFHDLNPEQMRTTHLWLRRKNNSSIFVEVRAKKLSDGRLIGFHRDMTEQKQIESELRESKKFLNMILNSIKDPIFVKNQNHQWILVNDVFCSFTGHSREDLIGKTDYDFFPKSEADVFWKHDDQVMNTGIDSENEEELMDASGKIHTISTKKSRHVTNSEEAFLIGSIRDITERKKMEDDIRLSLKEKEVLIHEVHHRVNNNLQIISSLISIQIKNVRNDTIQEFLRETQSRIRSFALVYELLSHSSNVEQIDYGPLMKKLCKSVFELYSIDNSRISVSLNDTQIVLPIIEAVPTSLIVRELLANSVLYAFPDGRHGEIDIGIEFNPITQFYTLRYDDNGVGIPDGKNFNSGKTLGMSLIYGLTRQLSGEVSITCKEGIHVVITFPLKIKNRISNN
jgi:PAS domain S-box-containing protein